MDKKTIGLFFKRNSPYLPYLLDKNVLYIYSSDKNINDLKLKALENDKHSIDELNYKFLLCIRYDEIKTLGVNKDYVFLITYDNSKISIILKRSELLKEERFLFPRVNLSIVE